MYGMKIPTTYITNRTGMVFENGVCVDPGVETPDPRDEALRLAREAMVEAERLFEAITDGEYTPDSFTGQPIRIALAAIDALKE